MPIYKPTELRLFLDSLGIAPKKGLSQNFLIDGNIIRKIVSVSNVQPGDLVLEVGPGPGSLTQALLEAGAQVIAVEMDKILAANLARFQTDTGQLEIFTQDIMKFPVEEALKSRLKQGQQAKVIANLPYHLTTPILAMLGPHHSLIASLTVMVQEEMAQRMTSKPGTPDYSSLTIFLEFYAKLKYGFSVSRNCFYPAPKVDSAVVVLELHKPPLEPDVAIQFFKLTRTAFGQRRKMMRASLKSILDPADVTAALEATGQNPQARPEDLSLETFLQLFAILESKFKE
jgi:16S rRNA (adenine1518-N6/adenine1519-N6)-dimethyltransferase